MNKEQFDRLTAALALQADLLNQIRQSLEVRLGDIRDRMARLPDRTIKDTPDPAVIPEPYFADPVFVPKLRVPVREEQPALPPQKPPGVGIAAAVAVGQRKALGAVLEALDGWIDTARSNHETLGHRAEPVGSECWRSFHPQDIRTMVNDVARELKLGAFADPTNPRENRR